MTPDQLAIIAALSGIGFAIVILGVGFYIVGSVLVGMVRRAISEL